MTLRILIGSCGLVLATAPLRAACFSTAGTPAGADIAPVVEVSRSSGVAPLSVFFDASGGFNPAADAPLVDITPWDIGDRPFHDLAYCWEFDDPASGNFSTTGRSKDEARGPVAGHVFETPGTYDVMLRVRDSQDREATQVVQITVGDPDAIFADANTRCFFNGPDNAANINGCPAGAMHVPNVTNLSSLQSHVAAGRRLLLRRGDAFTADATVSLNAEGPGLIGAYGAGNRPVLSTSRVVFQISNGASPQFADWSLMDLDYRGSTLSAKLAVVEGTARNLLVLRARIAGGGTSIEAGTGVIDFYVNSGFPNDIIDGLAVQDAEFDGVDNYAFFVSSRRFLLLGNRLVNGRPTNPGSATRMPWLDRAVLSHNDLGPGRFDGGSVFYIHGPAHTSASPSIGNGQYANRLLVSDNVIHPGDVQDWAVYFGRQNPFEDERLRDVIFERNLIMPANGALQAGLVLRGEVRRATVRDNLFRDACVWLSAYDGSATPPFPADVSLFHNTCVDGPDNATLVDFNAASAGVRAHNNLVVDSNGGVLSAGSGVFAAAPSGNVLATASQAGFAAWPPSAAADYVPSGASVLGDPAFRGTWDHSGAHRTGVIEAGALEAAGGPADTMSPARPRGLRIRP